MKLRKLIICITMLLLLTGCGAVYNLDISGNSVKETSNILLPKDMATKENVDIVINNIAGKYFLNSDFLINPNKKNIEQKDKIGISLPSNYGLKSFNRSYALGACYNSASLIIDDKENITLETNNNFNCYEKYSELSTVTVNITTNHKVLENNADIIKGKKYTWNITKDNAMDKSIKMVLSKEYNEEKITKNNVVSSVLPILLIILIFGGVIAIVGTYLYFKNKQNNKL